MVPTIGIFCQRTLENRKEIYRAVKILTKALRPYRNVTINIANEQNSSFYRQYEAFDFNDPQNIINLCWHVKSLILKES